MIVGGWYARAPEKGKEKFLFGTSEIGLEGLGGFEAKRLFAEAAEFSNEAFFDLGRLLPREITGFVEGKKIEIGDILCCSCQEGKLKYLSFVETVS